jgi:hypothetical protein
LILIYFIKRYMTIKKKSTNLNRRRRPLGKIYRSFEDDV